MAEAFCRAREFVEKRKKEAQAPYLIQLEFPEFKQGRFTVNRVYQFQPLIIGMYSADRGMISFNKDTCLQISAFAKNRGLKLTFKGLDAFLEDRGEMVAWLRENFFGSSNQELFEHIGLEIYGLSTEDKPRKDKYIQPERSS
ncbi:MAG: hypothetical protein ABIH76_03585 [Candidatus Bathyarchaeota archaeon]